MTPNTEAACGLCSCTAPEVDQLVKLGQMGFICLSCLEQVAAAALPLMALSVRRPDAEHVVPQNNIIQLKPRQRPLAARTPS